MDGRHWAKVSKRRITERKRLKLKTLTLMRIYNQYDFIYLFSRKSFKRSWRSSDNEFFSNENLKGA